MFYGRAFTISLIAESSVTIESPDIQGAVEIPRESFKAIYADWRHYRYESLSSSNSQETLRVISIIGHVVQTWVRREERVELMTIARKAGIPDGVFWIINYNRHGRIIGPQPAGEPVLVREVFPDEQGPHLSELELAASGLHESANALSELICSKADLDAVGMLAAKYPGFSKDVYGSVVYRACYLASK